MSNSAQTTKAPLVLSSDKNGVRTLTMNDPAKLNGWTKPMMTTLFDAFNAAAADPEVLSYPSIFNIRYYPMMIDDARHSVIIHKACYVLTLYLQNVPSPAGIQWLKLANMNLAHFLINISDFPSFFSRYPCSLLKVKVLVLTGAGKYYCAGVNLAGVLKPMHPQKLHDLIYQQNKMVFDVFLDFPKPLIAALNGPAIGASVTTATLCDALLMAEETATLSTPFAKLGVPPEGCSSVHFPRMLGAATAQRLLGPEGWQPTAAEAVVCGLATESVPANDLLPTAQRLGEAWVANGKTHRAVPQPLVPNGAAAAAATTPEQVKAAEAVWKEYKAANDTESQDLARAFLGPSFLQGQVDFLTSKGKSQAALFFKLLLSTRPLWSSLLSEDADVLRHTK
jgi:enoyl-CoA hydratase/carnithine racemase